MEMNQTQRLNKKPKYWAMSVAAVLVTAFVLVQPTMQTSYGQVADEGVPAYFACEFEDGEQAEDPWSMTSVRVQDVAKTIFAEKEIFECKTVQGNLELIVDVTTIAEIYENMTNKNIILKQTEVITCASLDADGTLLGCDVYTPTTDFIPVSDCDDDVGDLEHPQEMNTVNKGKTVKTIIVQKELWECEFHTDDGARGEDDFYDDKKIEQYTIEEIWENLNLLPGNPVTLKTVESLRCTTLIEEAFVESCLFTPVQVQELEV